MGIKSWLRGFRSRIATSAPAARPPRRARKQARLAKLLLEWLESRVVPATITWTNPAGGPWSVAGNWDLGRVPNSTDTVIITGLNAGAAVTHTAGTDTVTGLQVGGDVNLTGGSLTVTSSATVQPGKTLAVSAPLTLGAGGTLTDNGTLTCNGAAVTFAYSFGTTTQLVVGNGGTLNATSTSFTAASTGNTTVLLVNAGGHLHASNSTFNITRVYFDDGSLLSAGDLNGNAFASSTFGTALFLPASGVQYLSGPGNNNLAFADVNILAGSLPSGQTLALNAIGGGSKLRYLFAGNFTVQAGATLSVAAGVKALVQPAVTLTDSGAATFAAGSSLELGYSFGTTTRLVVGNGGALNAASTSFTATSTGNTTQIIVSAGGRLRAGNSTFSITQVSYEDASLLSAGDLSGNAFDTTLSLPAAYVQYLSGPGSDNLRFRDIDILAGSLPAGQALALNAIGGGSALRYVFAGNFTVQAGATLSVAAGVKTLIQPGVTLANSGTLNFAAGAAVELGYAFGTTTQIVVNNGGLLNASGASFSASSTGNTTLLTVNAGGRLRASGSTFNITQVKLDDGSLLSAGDLAGNTFNSPLFLPAGGVQYLSGPGNENLRFTDVNLLAGSLTAGQTVNLNPIGTGSLGTQRYVFPGNFTVQSGAVLNVGTGANLLLRSGQTITVGAGGAMNVTGAASFVIEDASFTPNHGIDVSGTFTATGTSFTRTANTSTVQRLQVNTGGHIDLSNSTFAWDILTLNIGSTGTIQLTNFASQVSIHSGSLVTFSNNDFSNVPNNGVIAVGVSTASIDLRPNYWGTTDSVVISNKVLDHADDATRPTILFDPPPSTRPTLTTAADAATTFSTSAHDIILTAAVTSPSATVTEGTVTFRVLNGAVVVGTPRMVNVVSGTATTTNYTLSAGLAPGTYTIEATYTGTSNFASSGPVTAVLTVSGAATTTTAANATAPFSSAAQPVTLSATVTPSSGTVSESTVTFTVLSGATVVGTPVSGSVSSGSASVSYLLPAGTAPGSYTIKAVFNGTINFASSMDVGHTLTVGAAATTTAAANVTATYSTASQVIDLSAAVSSAASVVNEGTITFTVRNPGGTVIGSVGPINVSTGAATGSFTLAGNPTLGTYNIRADYTGTASFASSFDTGHAITVVAAPAATVSVALDPGSDSGAPNHSGFTNDSTPTFNVQVNQAGTITMKFDAVPAHDQSLVVTAAGTYSFTPTAALTDGGKTAQATFNAGLAGAPASTQAYTIDTVRPTATTLTPTGTVNNTLAQADVTFSEPIDLNTFSPAAITLTGPAGDITVNQPTLVSGNTYRVTFPPQSDPGSYTLVISTAATDFAGNALASAFSRTFSIALPDLALTATSAPPAAGVGGTIPVGWTVANVSASNPTAGSWNDAVYLSTQPVLDGSAIRLLTLAAPAGPLSPGTNYSRSTSVTIPNTIPAGNYFLLFVANDNAGQAEANRSNNVAAAAVALTAPDLQVTDLSGPASGFTGQAVLFSWTVVNNGDAPAVGPWVDRIYTVSDTAGSDPVLAASFQFDGTLAAGESVQRTQQILLPQTPGTRYFRVTANAAQAPAESTYGNNTLISSTPVSIAAVPLPNLVVTSVTPPPNGVFSGTSVPISFTVRNQGMAATTAPVWKDWVILSQDAMLGTTYQGQLNPTGPGGDQLLNNQPVVVGVNNPSYLGVGESYTQTVNVKLPLTAQGIWYVYVLPDGTGAHHPFAMPQERRTDKLALSPAFSVTLSPSPDLVPSAVQAPPSSFSGQTARVTWTVTNNGTGPTVASGWTDAVYLSTDATLDAGDKLLATVPHDGALDAGAHYDAGQTVTLPVGISGPYFFLVKTDSKGEVFEPGATGNNVAASTAKTVNLTPPPDLEVSAITAPATAVAGRDFTFSYTVVNNGSTGAGSTPNFTWNDRIYLSPTATFNAATATPLGQQTHQGSLDRGASYTNTVTLRLPSGLLGNYYVFVETDSGNVVFEASVGEGNNRRGTTSPVAVTQAPADLTVSAPSAPAVALPGTAIPVRWTVTNSSGSATPVGSWHDKVYIDTGSTLTAGAVLLGSFAHNGVLAAGGSYTQSQLVTLPINLLGNYNLFVVTDSDAEVQESSDSNNTSAPAAIALQLVVGGVPAAVSDLRVTSVSNTPVSGGSVTVNWTVQNQGTGPTNATLWNDDVWASTNPTLEPGTDIFLGSVQHTNPLAAGASYSASGTFTIPQALLSGNYYFIVATDRPVPAPNDPTPEDNNRVYESDPTNNTTATPAPAPAAPAALPDLAASNVTAPATATAGGQLAVSWRVTNNGPGAVTGPIVDSVYLSYDTVFDSTSDRYLGSLTHTGTLGVGASYTQNATLPLRPGLAGNFYVIVRSNSNNQLAEVSTSDDTSRAPSQVAIGLPPPADLVAGTITIPPTALAGENITITYQVTNTGTIPANGTWTDSLYLSPTPTWNVGNPLLGEVAQTRSLAPGGSYTGTLTAPLPGVAPGSYYVLLRTNILATFPEPTQSNNLSASVTQSSIDAQLLPLGAPTSGTLRSGQSAYYKVTGATAGQTLQISLSTLSASFNELYVSFGTMPTRSKYDFRYRRPFEANQQVTVPTTRAGAYYILAYGDKVPGTSESYTIQANLIPFSIQSVSPGQAGTGPVTLQISGAQFNFGTTFQLRNSGGTVVNATRTLLQDSATAFATFDLSGKELSTYDVWAVQPDTTTTRLLAGLTVSDAKPSVAQVSLVPPRAVLVGRPGTLTISYSNPGNTDAAAPLILLKGDNALFQAPGGTEFTHSSLQLIGYNSAGPFGTLPPGFQGSITVPFKPASAGAGLVSTFTVETLQDPTAPFDWDSFAANDVPANTSPQQWAALVSQAKPLLGATWGEVVASLDKDSIQLLKNVAGPADPNASNRVADFCALLQYAVGVYGAAAPAVVTPPLPVVASQGEVTLYNARVDGSGNAIALNPSYPTFVLVAGFDGYRTAYRALADAIAASPRFPMGHVNVLVATWQGASANPTFHGIRVPWVAALHVDAAGAQLGDLLSGLDRDGKIAISSTSVLGEGLGAYVGKQAAVITGGLQNVLALDPSSPLAGYLPPTLKDFFQHSTDYTTPSFFDAQLSLAASNQAIPLGDLNDPILQRTSGVPWLTGQLQIGNDYLLNPTYRAKADALPPSTDAPCPADPAGVTVDTASVVQVESHDPNSIIGPQGSGTDDTVPPELPMPYTILFTNQSTAQAPAQQVSIAQQLDPDLDWRAFRLDSFGFAGRTFSIPGSPSYYHTTLDLRQELGFDVDFTATIDVTTGTATWTFLSLDPGTMEVPLDPTIGLLPPNNSDGIGEGFVRYTVLPSSAAPTGTVIDAQATIVFDNQPPIDTERIFNTLDTGEGLASSVAALPQYQTAAELMVSWSGATASNGSGVRDYTIYVSDTGGPYVPWLQDTTLTSAPFDGRDGHTYRFYSVATDNAGNVERAPDNADATTTVDVSPPTITVPALPPGSPRTFTVRWSGSDSVSGVASYDVFVSDNGGAPAPLLTGTALTSTSFSGSDGHTYGFYVVGTDRAGNRGALPATPQASTAVDALPPTSSVTAFPMAATMLPDLPVSWSGSDAVSGIGSYRIFVSDNGGPAMLWLGPTTATSGTYHGTVGHTYGFYSVATDGAGNVEATPASPQATVAVVGATVTLRLNGGNVELVDAGRVALTRPNNDPRPLVIQGSNAQSDTLRLDFSGGVFTLPGGTQFNAGTGAGDDDGLELVGTGSIPAVVMTGATETLTYAGNTVAATGLEKQMVTAVQDLTVRTPEGDDNLGITQPAAGQNRITGIPAPLTFSGVASLTLDLGAGDSPSAVNSFTLPGSWAAAALGKVVILGGAGGDTLKVTAPIPSLPAAGEGYRFDGQGGADTIDASGDTDWTLSPSALQSGPGGSGGVIALANVDQGKLTGGAGNNRLNASAFLGSVTLDGQAGNDTLTGGGGDDLLTGGPGNDSIDGGGGSDTLAESGNTSMALTSTSFAAVALLGTDTLSSIEQARLAGGAGNNVLDASRFPGTVYFTGGLGSDKFLGGAGANWLLESGDVNFTLTGTSLTRTSASSVVLGTDMLSRVTGVQLTGGPGDNVFVVSSWISSVLGKIDGGGGADTVVCAGDVVAASLGNTNFALTDAQLTRKFGNTAYGAFTLTSIEVASLSGGASNNTLDASGFSGTTYLTGGLGNDTFRGGSGFDWLVESGNTNFALTNTSLSGVGADSLAGIDGAILTGGAGNNTLDARGFSGKVILNGGAGSDALYAGAGGGVLLGGAGNDVLSAGAGRAVLIGGAGVDFLFGGAGDDLLIHGATAYDASTAALLAVLAEWQRSDQTYSQRIDHLRNGTGLNGAARLTAATVPDDASSGDQLTGGGGDDWFWAKLPFDLLKDRKSNEQVN